MALSRSAAHAPSRDRPAGWAGGPAPDVAARWPAGRAVGRLAYPTGHGEATTVVDVVLRHRGTRSLPHFRLPEFHPARGYVAGREVGLDVRSTVTADRSLLIIGSVAALDRLPWSDDGLETWPTGVHAQEFVVVPSVVEMVPDVDGDPGGPGEDLRLGSRPGPWSRGPGTLDGGIAARRHPRWSRGTSSPTV